MNRKPKHPNGREERVFACNSIEVRKGEGEVRKIEGHAAVFNRESEPIWGEFREVIAPGAFKRALKEKHDVRALFNHDPSLILGRSKAGTLEMREDKDGLAVTIVPADTQAGRDTLTSIERGDIDQMSFGFRALKESWTERGSSDGLDLRTIEDVELFDVSPVTYPAYQDTDVAVRMRDEWRGAQETSGDDPSPEGDEPSEDPQAPSDAGEGESSSPEETDAGEDAQGDPVDDAPDAPADDPEAEASLDPEIEAKSLLLDLAESDC